MSSTINHAYSSLSIGDSDQLTHTVTEGDIRLFAASSGDNNPVHLDHDYAEHSRFGGVIAHGMYSGVLISRMLGTQFPGPGTIYLSQTLNFRAPVRPGDTLTVNVEVIALHEHKPVATLACTVTNQNDELVTDGESVVLVPKESKRVKMPEVPVFEERQ
ncbi:MaoC/PaaZ C-terminal domain-containing protein [Thalassolituus sp. UBA3500]|uniref:MaoC/PaaZ C-terminal domain-containing protein n=1 Tax=Thalassolituus sp. UBA3500 TaxID=1947664 RepID=UPI00263B10B9|nr:MaoC/PaaZ C-terminal domain-containing protein [Thalassolituus sp. UBA3500]|tara:strand:+ start:2611 stop:3087 length:477 start_codon:yes stop_codon:yes gene_type:complete